MFTLVFSYSHDDENLRDELEKHLSPLKRSSKIATWHDRRIQVGTDWKGNIDSNFATADIILLLISASFISSDYCYEIEMQTALERHDQGQAVVIPIILRPCNWKKLPFGKLQAATKDGKPITDYPDYNTGFFEVSLSIGAAVDSLMSKKNIASNSSIDDYPVKDIKTNNSLITKLTPRSSNLAIKKAYTDLDKANFCADGFQFISKFIKNSLVELEKRNSEISYRMDNIDSRSFIVEIYIGGSIKAKCGIWVLTASYSSGGIMYSSDGVTKNSYNGHVIVDSDGTLLGFKSIMSMWRMDGDILLTHEGVSEYFWDLLISPLKVGV